MGVTEEGVGVYLIKCPIIHPLVRSVLNFKLRFWDEFDEHQNKRVGFQTDC